MVDDLFVNLPDRRFGLRDPHLPPSLGVDQITTRIVPHPLAPQAYRPAITSASLAMPVPLAVPVITDAARRRSARRITRHAFTLKTGNAQASVKAQVRRIRPIIGKLRDRAARGR